MTAGSVAALTYLLITGRLDVAQAGTAGAAMLLVSAQLRGLVSAGSILSEATKVRGLYEGRTVLLISHRYSTIRSADRIIVMRGGQIVESGGHHSLLAAGGLYAELYTLQSTELDAATSAPAAPGNGNGHRGEPVIGTGGC